jgi:hypothetical protein
MFNRTCAVQQCDTYHSIDCYEFARTSRWSFCLKNGLGFDILSGEEKVSRHWRKVRKSCGCYKLGQPDPYEEFKKFAQNVAKTKEKSKKVSPAVLLTVN